MTNPVTIGVVIAYLVATVLVGAIIANRQKAQSMSDYFVSERSLSPTAIACAAVATAMSGTMFIGLPANTFQNGYPQIMAVPFLSGNIGIGLSILLLGKPLRKFSERHNSVTIVDVIVDMFHVPAIRYVAVPTMLIASVAFAMVQWQSIGVLLNSLLGLDYKTAVILGVIVVVLYSILGGNTSNALVSIVQMFIAIFAALYLAFLGLKLAGGLTALNGSLAAIDPGLLKTTNSTFSGWAFFSYWILYFFGQSGQPGIITKYFSIKDPKLFPRCLFIGIFSHIAIGYLPVCAMYLRTQVESGAVPPLETLDSAMPTFVGLYSNPFIGGVLIAAALAAIMSTVCSLLLSISSTAVSDLMSNMLHMDCSGKKGVTYSRIALIIGTVISAVLALNPSGGVQEMGAAAWGVFEAVFFPACVFGLRWRRSTRVGAQASMWGAFGFIVVFRVLKMTGIWVWPFAMSIEATAVCLSIVLMIGGSLLSPREDKSHYMPPTRKELMQMQH